MQYIALGCDTKFCIVKNPVCNVAIQNSNLFILGLHYVAIQNSKCISTLNIPSVLYCNTISPSLAIQSLATTQPRLQYNSFLLQYTYLAYPMLQYNGVLQYTHEPFKPFKSQYNTSIAIQIFFFSQHNWAVAQFSPSRNFFFFSHNFFFHILATGKYKKKIYIHFFFIFPEYQINLNL